MCDDPSQLLANLPPINATDDATDVRGVSEAKLLTCLNRLGHDIEIVVRPRRPRGTPGRTRVIGR